MWWDSDDLIITNDKFNVEDMTDFIRFSGRWVIITH